jgi:hypothetical protein
MKWMQKPLRVLLGAAFSLSVIIGLFQNCSKIQVSDMPTEDFSSKLGVSTAKISVDTADLADLKMLFVIDNSYTMKANNINLANSYQTLFNAQNSDSLEPFQVTSYVIPLAQKVPAASLADQARLNQLMNSQVLPSSIIADDLPGLRAPNMFGTLAGDSIGYSIEAKMGSFLFEPASMVGDIGDGKISAGMVKKKSLLAAPMVEEFRKRLTLMQGLSITNYEKDKDILDQESGLCAIARTLRSPGNFFKAGDISVLNVLTDEDDADAAGNSCLSSYTYSEGNEDLIDGGCETRKTNFAYSVDVLKPAQCVIGYNDTFDWKLIYNVSSIRSSVSYHKIDNYTCPQTEIKFDSVSAWKKKRTSISIVYKPYKVFDGVNVYDNPVTKAVTVDGYKSIAECLVIANNNLNSASEQYASNTCNQVLADVGTSCSFSDVNCVIAGQVSKTVNVTGDYTLNADCVSRASSLDSSYISGSAVCKLLATTVVSASSIKGCSANISATTTTVNNIAKDLSTQAACDTEAKSRGGYVTATYPATCTTAPVTVQNSRTGSLALASYVSVTAVGACPTDVRAKAVSLSGVSSSSVVSCDIQSIPARSSTMNLSGATCADDATLYCAANSNFVNCMLKSTSPAVKVPTPSASTADEELACLSLCQDSKTDFCKANGNLPVVAPTMTVQDYLAQALGASNCKATVSQSAELSKFQAKPAKMKVDLCPAKSQAGLPVYARVDRTFRFKGFAPDYVVGNSYLPDGSIVPKVDLPTYISQRSAEYFGGQRPIINMFVRTVNDSLGSAGSRGLAYERLAMIMGGQVNSVLSQDYSAALKDLSTIIKSKITRSFKVPSMADTQHVVAVRLFSQGVWRSLGSTEWSQAGDTVILSDQVLLGLGDKLEIDFQ